ncbi:agamous-like MADS-box protein MADS4 [Triticum dicoccoides]|uniref:agamous-like MADS-box protein MADS4 n=1 Tax=Triticum dicoccoides TaxID=85692 RepID=UPI00188F06D0|nr:agamous-like MADS-box protein MADS4 [Triticum dicoccoides]
MARKKVPLRYIGNSTRRRTYETRRNNLMKKADELGILCNTKICMLVYDEGTAAPDVYPSHMEAMAILNRYKNMPDMARFKKVVTQEEFLTKQVAKLQHEANKLWREREDRDTRILLHKAMLSANLNVEEVARVGYKLQEIRKSLADRIANTSGQPPFFQPQAPYVTGGVNMGPPSLDQVPPQQEGWQPEVFQAQAPQVTSNADKGYLPPQAPYVTGNVDMGPLQMYHVPPQQHDWQPPTFQPQAPYVPSSVDMGPPPMYQEPRQQEEGWQTPVFHPQVPYVIGSINRGPSSMY